MNLSKIQKRVGGAQPSSFHLSGISYQPEEPAAEKRTLRWAIGLAVAFHALLLALQLPTTEAEPEWVDPERPVYVVQQLRFKPPEVAQQATPPKPEARKIPIPDPTPDDPEPILPELEIELDLEVYDETAELFGIPESGPPGAVGGGSGDVLTIGGDVLAPVKSFAPEPTFSEEARAARVQGVVLLQAIVGRDGSIRNVKVLKGLPFGLTESAMETVKTWRYKPATRDGEPVAVYLHLTIGFWLQ